MKRVIGLLAMVLLLAGCSSDEKFEKTPLDLMIRELSPKGNDFTIVLADMDLEEHTFSSDIYKHKYRIVTMEQVEGDSLPTPKSVETDWYEVRQPYFDQYVNAMGMEIASMTNGKVNRQIAPAGYSQYVGNERYGQWRTDSNGMSFWEFYGRYAMMRTLFDWTFYSPVRRSYYQDYSRSRTAGRPYYGTTTTGTARYGSFSKASTTAPTAKKSTFTRKLSSSSNFSNKVSRSASRSSSSAVSGKRSTTTGSKTSRSSSRYGSSSSSRSRSSGRGGK